MDQHHLDDIEALVPADFEILVGLFTRQPGEQEPAGVAEPEEGFAFLRLKEMFVR